MRAYLTRRNLLLAAITGLILYYFYYLALWAYVGALLAVVVIFHLVSAQSTVKVANFIANTATVVIAFLVLVVLVEIGLHLDPHFFIGAHDPDTYGEFSDYTSRGYLTEKVFKKEKGVFRILGLGDSFAVYPAKNPQLNYHSLLREKFAVIAPGKVEIVNAGMPGIGPGYYWHTLEKFGDRFQPDLVLVGFFAGNDFDEWQMYITINDVIFEPSDLTEKIREYRKFKNSRLIKLIRGKYILYHEKQQQLRETKEMGGWDGGSFSKEGFLEIEKSRSWIFQKNRREAMERQGQHCAERIAQMKKWCDDRQVEMVLMIFPDQFQVDADLRKEVLQKYHIPAESLDLEYPNAYLANYCRTNHIHCLNLLPPFQEAGQSRQLYALRDTHWNAAGNRLAAEVIFKYLQDQKLIKFE